MRNELRNNELAVLYEIESYYKAYNITPSYRYIMKRLDYKSPRSIQLIINKLIEKEILIKTKDGYKMQESIWERFKKFVCLKIGHNQGNTWKHKGLNANCKRCGCIYKVKQEII